MDLLLSKVTPEYTTTSDMFPEVSRRYPEDFFIEISR